MRHGSHLSQFHHWQKKMEYLSSEHVHKKFNMNVMFLYLIEVHISSICDSDVLYEVFKFYLTEQTFIS